MLEATWLASSDPQAMLELLQHGLTPFVGVSMGPIKVTSPRKLRLFACACCRQVWDKLTDDSPCHDCATWEGKYLEPKKRNRPCPTCRTITGRINRSRNAVIVAERFADGLATEEEKRLAWQESDCDADSLLFAAHMTCNGERRAPTVDLILRYLKERGGQSPATQAWLLREVFGNPFRRVELPYELSQVQAVANVILKPSPASKGHCYWLTSTVVSLAQACYESRDFSVMPMLRDALEESGCTDESLLNHCLEPIHVRGCFLLDLILGKS